MIMHIFLTYFLSCLYGLKCRKCGQLILRKIIKIVAKAKIRFQLGSAPDPAVGAYSAPRPLAALKGLILKAYF